MSELLNINTETMKSPNIYLFGYGSLINPKSIQRTLGREIKVEYLIEAMIYNYVRKWQVVDWVIIEEYNMEKPIPAIFLDMVRQSGAMTNGILIPIFENELDKMDKRERKYDRVNVSNLIEPRISEYIFTYIGKKEHTTPPKESCVLLEYEKIIEEGFNFWNKAFKQHYYEFTISHKLPLKNGKYTFART